MTEPANGSGRPGDSAADAEPTAVLSPPEATGRTEATAVLHPSEPTAAGAGDGPRIRWAGILWGLVFAAIAATTLWTVVDPERRDAASAWWSSLEPAMLGLMLLLALGGILLVAGLAGVLRRASRSRG
ncbi:hypothetical protein [Agromyces marinus]|uniref:Uncharacterized protein n=1 Tax=Agromyces marinus TaxID=1389020 RepID=A0ABN6YA85_9MICO|nr:hypothetical protein [Agromyces marinus]UIP57571.1 hypothetical protein DSM26151_04350 [Agromyces marinus]BDZ54282.1 hypothetical protein GCM10025870_13550 [Agromyces marinus]